MAEPTDDDLIAHVRSLALALPETRETTQEGWPVFCIDAASFAIVRPGAKAVAVRSGEAEEKWIELAIRGSGTDWDAIDDGIAHSWELAAPRRLLEAGGR